MADMIEIKHLNKYFGDLHVLKDINLTVKRGEKLVMIGPSGSGKSTLIRCVRSPKRITWRWLASTAPWCFSSSTCIPT